MRAKNVTFLFGSGTRMIFLLLQSMAVANNGSMGSTLYSDAFGASRREGVACVNDFPLTIV